jgi:type IV pilus assembly protein PilW
MSHTSPNSSIARHPAQTGFTLIELMIAILIGLFLVGGLLTLVGAMKRTSGLQTNLTQMQDNERLAMSLITDVVQSAGYYPDPHTAASIALPSVTVGTDVFAATQSLYGVGTVNAVAPGDTMTVRYGTSGTDNVINCMGSPSGGAAVTFVNQFSIDPATNSLRCTLSTINGAGVVVSTTTLPLVTGVLNLQVTYGMKSAVATTSLAADSYLDATQVSALAQSATSGWTQVMTVKVTLTMTNLLSVQANGAAVPGQPAIVAFTRVIDVMNKTGVRS